MNQLWWYVARSGGLLSWALLAAAVLWGLALSSRIFGKRPRPAWLLDLHRYLGGLALVFLGVHVLAILLDGYVHFGLSQVLVPFASTWHAGAVAWGIVGLYLLLAVELTSLLRRHLPLRVWRRIHYLSFPLFVVATIHAMTAGTDRSTLAMQIAVFCVTGLVVLLTALRALPTRSNSEPGSAPPRHRPNQPTPDRAPAPRTRPETPPPRRRVPERTPV
jgi:Ferric reductase like transmembrane component